MTYDLILQRRFEERRVRRKFRRVRTMLLALIFGAGVLSATDFVIHLPDTPPVSRQSVTYQCDATGLAIGVPSRAFTVEYINAGGNSLAIVPISGNSLIFSNVASASGARYVAQQYTWWEAKGGATLYSDSLNGKSQSSCHKVPVGKQVMPKD
jgi:membrane-bound inhibitor of C-type lysozyme